MNEKPLINRVANSGLITFDLEKLYPETEIIQFDIKNFLFKEFLLKEKDFRAALKEYDWQSLKNKTILIFCSNDAIIPLWAFMLIASYARPIADQIYHGKLNAFLSHYYREKISALNPAPYEGKRVVVKGCGSKPVPSSAYTDLTVKLQPHVLSLMYGEPCSTVPIFKKRP